jgi:hypothetical protein
MRAHHEQGLSRRYRAGLWHAFLALSHALDE